MWKLLQGLIALFITLSCTNSDCNDVKKAFYPDEYNLIVISATIDQTWIKASGYSQTKNSSDNIMVHNNWMIDSKEIESGDIIKKEKGQLVLSIHKKHTIINHEWFCKGKPIDKIYKNPELTIRISHFRKPTKNCKFAFINPNNKS